MSKKIKAMFCGALTTSIALASTANGAVLINEIYSGGGSNTAALYTRDYVELVNNGLTAVDLSGWRVTYASAAGNFGTNNVVAFGTGSSIAAGDTLLLVSGSAGTAGVAIPGANYYNGTTSGASLSATAGSVTLLNAANAQVDTVGFGATVTSPDSGGLLKFETAAAPAPAAGNLMSISRTGGALAIDTNNNSVDFTSQTPSPLGGTRSTVVVPEPTSLAVVGLASLVLRRRRQA